jgi:hypothetical protein
MEEVESYESFPFWIVLLSGLVSLSIYAVGAFILSRLGTVYLILYLLYCLGIEIWILRSSCAHCYYYGKVCGLGKGKLCSLLFPKGDPRKFIQREASWTALLPDLMVFIFPIAGGIFLLITDFSWLMAAMLAILVVLVSVGNAVIRGSLACKYCKQRELGCPAEKMFGEATG